MSKSKKPDGMVIKRSQDRTHSSVTVAEYAPAPAPGKSNRTLANCSICGKPVSFTGSVPDPVICLECKEKPDKDAKRAEQAEKASRTICTCKKCGKTFYIKASKVKQLKDAGIEPFTTCYACQQEKKAKEAERIQKSDDASKIYCKCKICGKQFYIPAEKAEKLKKDGHPLFDTCYTCQQDIKYYDKLMKERGE